MTGAEWAMLGAGILLLFGSGAWHLGGILLINRIKPDSKGHPHWSVLLTFWGIALLHLSEIAIGALVLGVTLTIPGAGAITQGYGDSSSGLLYFSGISFATLGFTQQNVSGPIRLLVMLQSLGGFMLITWSATFVYSVWEERFRQSGEDE